jgi:hypothetical protein
VLRAYYGSAAQPYWINVMRYVVGESKAESSFGYHIDDNPRQILKIFIYLNDTFESNGAFRAFDYSVTQEICDRGFISCSPELRRESQVFITPQLERERLQVLEGKCGTVLIFDNNLIHKGTLPRTGYRDVICVEIYPSARPWTQDDIAKGLLAPIVLDYPRNPFVNDILRNR